MIGYRATNSTHSIYEKVSFKNSWEEHERR